MNHIYRPAGSGAGPLPRSRAGIRLRPANALEAFPVNNTVELIRPVQAGVCSPGLNVSNSRPDIAAANVSNAVFTPPGIGAVELNAAKPSRQPLHDLLGFNQASPVGGASRPFSMSNPIGVQAMVRDAPLHGLRII